MNKNTAAKLICQMEMSEFREVNISDVKRVMHHYETLLRADSELRGAALGKKKSRKKSVKKATVSKPVQAPAKKAGRPKKVTTDELDF